MYAAAEPTRLYTGGNAGLGYASIADDDDVCVYLSDGHREYHKTTCNF